MPHEQMSEQQTAAYLHLDRQELVRLAQRKRIPSRRTAKGYVFRKGELDHWIEQQIHLLDHRRLEEIERGVSAHHGLPEDQPLVTALIPENGLAVPLEARTRPSAIRALVRLAEGANLVHDSAHLVEEVLAREDLCSTALTPMVALPHPRHPLPYDIAASFVVAGLAPSGIPFGAPDGSLTRLFLMICCKDERTHLHVLARLARMLHDPSAAREMIAAADAGELRRAILGREQTVLDSE
jgi:PTS system nitrogen regulatory IIA component